MPNRSILICEDETVIRDTMAEFLTGEEYEVVAVGTFADAVAEVQKRDFHVAICDVQLPDGDGVQLLRRIQQANPHTFVLIITAYASVESSVEAFKRGAFDYLIKPVRFEDLEAKLGRVFQYRELFLENQALRRELAREPAGDDIVGSGKLLTELKARVGAVALTNSSVLLTGPTGTGKELFARAIHKAGKQGDKNFLPVSCNLRPEEVLEAELFGSEVGEESRPGALRAAGKGTVLLDEIAELPRGAQTPLLRALEYGEAVPVGGSEPYKVEARIIASTSRDLSELVEKGEFEADLFYRLDGTKLSIPPLEDRLDDVPELVEHFVNKHSTAMGKRVTGASSEAIRLLLAAEWPGHVRQLDNAVQRAVMHCETTVLEPGDLPPEAAGLSQPPPDHDDLRSALRHYERLHIQRVLRQCPDKRAAAKRLKLGLSSLYRKIEELGIEL